MSDNNDALLNDDALLSRFCDGEKLEIRRPIVERDAQTRNAKANEKSESTEIFACLLRIWKNKT